MQKVKNPYFCNYSLGNIVKNFLKERIKCYPKQLKSKVQMAIRYPLDVYF